MFEPGSILGAYRILRPLGKGGMGRVYEVEHVALGIRRALKVFETESTHGEFLRKRFVAEGRILADLSHPRIVRVYDFAVDAATGAPYFAMDLILNPSGRCETLEDVCREGGADEDRVAGWFRDICEGLAYIHAKGVVHRDISLDNILIGMDGRAVITDFGIAKIVGEEYRHRIAVTRTMPLKDGAGVNWGKGLYQAPELKRGVEATPAADAYALGVILFRLLAGSWYTPAARLEDALAGLSHNWAEVIGRLCAADPAARLGTDGLPSVAALLRKTPAASPWYGTRRRVALVAAAVALALGAVVALAHRWWNGESSAADRKPEAPRVTNVVVTNVVPQTVYQIVPVTNTVFHIVDVTNSVPAAK